MTTTLVHPASVQDAKPKQSFAGRGMLENLQQPSALDRLKANLASCACEGFDAVSFSSSISSATGTRISGGKAMIVGADEGSYLLYKEPYEGFHLIVSGLLGVKPGDATVLRQQGGDSLFLIRVPEDKRHVVDEGRS